MMKCYRCSTRNPDDAVCCRYCGAPFIEEEETSGEEGAREGEKTGLLLSKETYYEENRPKRISFFTRCAYRVLSSRRRYVLAFALMAVFALCFSLLIVLLSRVGQDAMNAFELTGMLSGPREIKVIQQAQQAWKLLWSYVAVIALCGAGLFFCGMTAYKMIKILIVFRERKRTIVPIDWEKVKKDS